MVSPTRKYRQQGADGSGDEPQTKPANQGVPSGAPQPPGALSDEDASLDARIRLKQERGEPLDAAERAFLARLPGDSDVPPDAFENRG